VRPANPAPANSANYPTYMKIQDIGIKENE